ncbi:MAG: nucleotide exchange factor GrpE [Bryobacteraceae bacterium]|nr:nucleotide exchange factor GrpE [Bryobacteraceae bacterium]MCX7604181.1 nucleotide exchange factor GrpE [Bryobacteraceae bacterium]
MSEQEVPNAIQDVAALSEEAQAALKSSGEEQAAAEAAPTEAETVAAERDRLAQEKAELQDRYLRLAAEFDNFRKRTERERLEAIEYAAMGAVKALLPVLDDFERALKAQSSDADYVRGIELIYQRFSDALKKLGLEPFESEGKPFDPNYHEAIERITDPNVEQDTVVAELQRGYLFKGRLLRAALVRVAVKG